jgi:MoaA/NifB/PqqE/SkfB family radical SAM enzyme
MIRTRTEPQANYRSVFCNGKTIRMPIDNSKPITELKFAEFYDCSFGSKCSGGCKYCYASALKNGIHYTNLAEKILNFFGKMTQDQLPYQVACGGESESMENPECWEALEAFNKLGIVPNLTSNGMYINEDTAAKVLKHCGGIAFTAHKHLKKYWTRAVDIMYEAKAKLNLHLIISDEKSILEFAQLYKEYSGKIDYFVLLPYMNVGHAEKNKKNVLLNLFKSKVDEVYKEGKLAFGANFYPFLMQNHKQYDLKMYPPEIFSKYLLLNDKMEMFNNSFEMKPVPFTLDKGCELGHSRSDFNFDNFITV